MLVYVPDADTEFTDDTVNVNCVLSWRQSGNGLGVQVDFRNGWSLDSSQWTGGAAARARELVLAALRANAAGKWGG
jgi:hypothetical protein